MNKQQMIEELKNVINILEVKIGNGLETETLREIVDDLQLGNKAIISDIVRWNKERLLDKQEFKLRVEIVNILEELIEMTGCESNEARKGAEILYDQYFRNYVYTDTECVDAFADIIVFATGSLLKLGYNPECVMREVIKEINSRSGKIVDGKFIKDKSSEAQAKWHKADFTKCKTKIKNIENRYIRGM